MRLIDAEELKYAIMTKTGVAEETWDQLYDSVLEEIDNAQTVTPIYPVNQTGKWIKITKDGITPIEYICSNCGRTVKSYYDEYIITKDFPFCHCGADMRGDAK